MRSPGAVIIGGFVNSLGLVRSLGARGVRVAVISTQPFDIAHRSRWCAEHLHFPQLASDPDGFVELLIERASHWAGWLLMPTNDEALLALSRHHDRLSLHYRVAAPNEDVARYFLDKKLMSDAAREVGAVCPVEYGPASLDVLERGGWRFPVVVKPRLNIHFASRFGAKLFFAEDEPALRRAIERVVAAEIAADVIEFVPGSDSEIYAYSLYVDRRGTPLGGVCIRKLRQGPHRFGVARVAEVVEDPGGLGEFTREICSRLGFCGFAAAEFKRDSRDGRFRFIEINGRSVIYNGLLRRAGLDLAGLAWNDFAGGNSAPVATHPWPGAWIHLHSDLLHSLFDRGDGLRFREFLSPYRREREFAVWSAADPMPFVHEWTRTASLAAKGALAGRGK